MKKTISMLLAILMLVSLCTCAYATDTEDGTLTTDVVMDLLYEGDNVAETAEEQAVNGIYRLAEMLGIAAAARATEEEYEYVNMYLDRIYEGAEEEDMGNPQMLALGAIQVFNLLELIAEQEDPDMEYQDNRDSLRAAFSEGDDDAENAKQQTVNALYHATYMAALILEEICPTEDMVAGVAEELEAFSQDDDACEDVNDQIVNGAYWLQRMLTGMVTLTAPDDDLAEAALELSEKNTQSANEEPDREKELVIWLYSGVQMAGEFAEELLAEAE